MTQFEKAVQAVENGNLHTPSVTYGTDKVDYFGYQLAVHLYNLRILATGMKMRGVKFTDIKKYYGLKGRSAKECVPEFQSLMDNFLSKPQMN